MTRDAWLNAYIAISPKLRAALSVTSRAGQVKRFAVVDNLAEQLDIDGDFGYAAYDLVAHMIDELEAIMAEGPGSWADDPLLDRHGRVARAAVEGMALEDLVVVIRELRLERFDPPLRLRHVDQLAPELAAVISDWLAPRVLKMLDRWRKAGAWEADVKLGFVPTRNARSA